MTARLTMPRAARIALLLAAVSAAPALAAPAEFSIEGTVRLGYDINPFLAAGNDLSSGYVQASIDPKVVKRTEKGQVAASAYYDRTEYFRSYGHSDEYGGRLEAEQRLTAKLLVNASLSYDSEVIGQSDDAVSGAPIDDIDVNLIGQRRRSNTYRAAGGWQYAVGPKDTISADASYSAIRYRGGPGGNDLDNYGGRIGWQHAVSPRTRIGVSGSVYRIDYETPVLATLIMEPQVTFSTQLSATWTFDAALGVSFSSLTLPLAPDRTSKGVSGNATLCHKGTKDNFCLYAGRTVSASGSGGSVERTQVGINYNRRLTETIGFSANGSYARSKVQTGLIPTREYVSLRGGLDWQVSPRVKIGTEGRYRDVFGGTLPIKADFGGDVYATIALPGKK